MSFLPSCVFSSSASDAAFPPVLVEVTSPFLGVSAGMPALSACVRIGAGGVGWFRTNLKAKN
eukprot:scaffold15478_cov318-Ochromonas_danica.AAC.1